MVINHSPDFEKVLIGFIELPDPRHWQPVAAMEKHLDLNYAKRVFFIDRQDFRAQESQSFKRQRRHVHR